MKLYNSKRELVELEGFEYLTSGGCAHIFRKGDIVVKQYNYDSDYHIYVNKKVFKALKEIGAPNIVKLHDYYYYYDSFISRMLYPLNLDLLPKCEGVQNTPGDTPLLR